METSHDFTSVFVARKMGVEAVEARIERGLTHNTAGTLSNNTLTRPHYSSFHREADDLLVDSGTSYLCSDANLEVESLH